jgi:hypothetical protein
MLPTAVSPAAAVKRPRYSPPQGSAGARWLGRRRHPILPLSGAVVPLLLRIP